MNLVEVFHSRELDEIDNVLEKGLRCKERLIREGTIPEERQPRNKFEAWRRRIIYFSPEPLTEEVAWVSILVDPEITLVGNMLLELDERRYQRSMMNLKTYLERQLTTGRYAHPLTARNKTKHNFRGLYEAEILIETERITPTTFHRYNRVNQNT